MRKFRWKLADWLEGIEHWSRYGQKHHRPTIELQTEIIETPFGDVHEIPPRRLCGQQYLGKFLGNTLLETVNGEEVYIGVFKMNRMDRFLEQGRYVIASQ